MGLLKKAESRSREIPDNKIETDIDRLYSLILDHSPLKLSRAAEMLGKKRDLVEDWARVLDAANLVKLRYPAVGEPELMHA